MKSQKTLLSSCFILLTLGSCLALVLLVSIAFGIDSHVNRVFGAPANHMSTQQRLYLSLQLILHEESLTTPLDANGSPQMFQIELGEATDAIIRRLEQEGLIEDSDALRIYLIYKGLDTTLQAGVYTLSPSQTPVDIAYTLQDATPTIVKFRILPGWRIEEIAQALPTSGIAIAPDDFLIIARSNPADGYLPYELPTHANMEGFLFPDIYQFRRDVPLQEFFSSILSNFDRNLSPDIRRGFEKQGLDIYQAITLASIVQREAVVEEEMPLIASVFFNRLKINMKLDSDPTVQYAVGYNPTQKTWWTNPLSSQDLTTNSPYNTYRNAGLPPGPICNPGLSALQAVAYPAQTPYYYFRAKCDGSGRHVFAETYQEHLNNGCP